MAIKLKTLQTTTNTKVQATGSAANGSWGCNGGGWMCSKK